MKFPLKFGWNLVEIMRKNGNFILYLIYNGVKYKLIQVPLNNEDKYLEISANYFVFRCLEDKAAVWHSSEEDLKINISLTSLKGNHFSPLIINEAETKSIIYVHFEIRNLTKSTSEFFKSIPKTIFGFRNNYLDESNLFCEDQTDYLVCEIQLNDTNSPRFTFKNSVESKIKEKNSSDKHLYFSYIFQLDSYGGFDGTIPIVYNESLNTEHSRDLLPTTEIPVTKITATVFGIWIAVIAAVFLIILFLTHLFRKQITDTMTNIIGESTRDELDNKNTKSENISLLEYENPNNFEIEEHENYVLRRLLWDGVAAGNVIGVTQLLNKHHILDSDILNEVESCYSSPYEEAQRRGQVEILKIFDKILGRPLSLSCSNELVVKVLKAHTKNIEMIFKAAEYGQYHHKEGVDMLLKTTGLNGTIQDSKGRTILHYAASKTIGKQGPLWRSEDINHLVKEHFCFPNAVDFNGQTALHALATIDNGKDSDTKDTYWKGQSMKVNKAWQSLAKQLIGLGCDPLFKDNRNLMPHEAALNSGNVSLSAYLKKLSKNAEESKIEFEFSTEEPISPELQNLFKDYIRNGFYRNVLSQQQDLLKLSVYEGSQKMLFLSLCAGANLLENFKKSYTAIELAHEPEENMNVPAIFPAVLRKAFYDQLIHECDYMKNDFSKPTLDCLISFGKTILKSGFSIAVLRELKEKINEINQEKVLISYAVTNGLNLLIQTLALIEVNFNSCDHFSSVFDYCLKHGMNRTFFLLLHNLEMTPSLFVNPPIYLSSTLIQDLLDREYYVVKNLYNNCNSSNSIRFETYLKYVEEIENQNINIELPSDDMLCFICENGLIAILQFILFTHQDIDVFKPIYECTNFNLIHLAAFYGQTSIISFVLNFCKVTVSPIKGKFEIHPGQLAAIRGHKETLDFLKEVNYMDILKIFDNCQDILENFYSNSKEPVAICTRESPLPLTPVNFDYERIFTFSFLRRLSTSKSSINQIDPVQIKKLSMEECIDKDLQKIGKELATHDERLMGKFFPMWNKDGFKISCISSNCNSPQFLYYYYVIENSCTVEQLHENNHLGLRPISDVPEYDELFLSHNFRGYFMINILKTLKTAKLKYLHLIPPIVNQRALEIEISYIFLHEKTFREIAIVILPAVNCTSEETLIDIPKSLYIPDSKEKIINNQFGIWKLSYISILNSLFKNLNENEKNILDFCLCLLFHLSSNDKLHKTESDVNRFLPKSKEKNCSNNLFGIELNELTSKMLNKVKECCCEYSFSFNITQIEKVSFCFIEELKFRESKEQWDMQDRIQKIISILNRSKKIDLFINSFVDLNEEITDYFIEIIQNLHTMID